MYQQMENNILMFSAFKKFKIPWMELECIMLSK